MFRRPHIFVYLVLVTLLAGLPGGRASAAGAGVKVVIHLEVPAAVLRCTECVVGGHGTVVREAVRSLTGDAPTSEREETGRFIRKGATFGGDDFSGTAVEVRRMESDAEAVSSRFVAI